MSLIIFRNGLDAFQGASAGTVFSPSIAGAERLTLQRESAVTWLLEPIKHITYHNHPFQCPGSVAKRGYSPLQIRLNRPPFPAQKEIISNAHLPKTRSISVRSTRLARALVRHHVADDGRNWFRGLPRTFLQPWTSITQRSIEPALAKPRPDMDSSFFTH